MVSEESAVYAPGSADLRHNNKGPGAAAGTLVHFKRMRFSYLRQPVQYIASSTLQLWYFLDLLPGW